MRLGGCIFLIFMSLLSLGNCVSAVPALNDLSVSDPEIWLGDTEIIFVNCTDDNYTISDVSADISTSSALFPGNSFLLDADGIYYLPISTSAQSNFNKVGIFDVTVYCQNENGDSVNSSISFTVSNLSIEISSMSSSVYIGDIAEINLFVKKDGSSISPISSNVIDLEVSVDGVALSLLPQPYYDSEKGWVLRYATDTFAVGTHTFSIVANYSGSVVEATKDVSVYDSVDFSIVDVDASWMSTDDTVTVSVKATEYGNPIVVDESQISVRIGSTTVSSFEILASSASDAYDIIFTAPSLSSGEHTLKVYLDYGNESLYDSENVIYVIPVSGVIFIETDNTHAVDLKFKSDDITKDVRTDNKGKYLFSFPPDDYDIEIEDSFFTLDIYDVEIDEFDDAIKYQYLPTSCVVGISGVGISYYGIASELDHDSVSLKLKYNSGINDISSIETYVCTDWDTGNKKCISEWNVIDSEIDSLRKTATISDAVLNAAYIIGNIDSLNVAGTIEKEIYNINEDIKITGLSQDSAKNVISGVTFDAYIDGTSISASEVSDSKGLFSFSISNPKVEGNYTLIINASKDPFISSQKTIDFEVLKRKDVAIVGPDTIRMYPGDSSEVEFLVINTGESVLSNLSLSLNGVSSNYYQMIYPDNILNLGESEEISVVVYFDIPLNASKEMISSSFELSGSGISKKQNFVMNVLAPKNDSLAAVASSSSESSMSDNSEKFFSLDRLSPFGMPTGNSIALLASGEAISVFLFAMLSFSTAFLFRKRRLTNVYSNKLRDSNRLLIFEIRKHMFKVKNQDKDVSNPSNPKCGFKRSEQPKRDTKNSISDISTRLERAIIASCPLDKKTVSGSDTKQDKRSDLRLDMISDIYDNLNNDGDEKIGCNDPEESKDIEASSDTADADESETKVF